MMAPTTSPPTAPVTPPPPAPPAPARLVRSRDDRVIAGVAGGLGRYLGLDPVLIRLGFVVLVLAGGSGVLAYLVAWLVIPEEAPGGEAPPAAHRPDSTTTQLVLGGLLVLVGAVALATRLVPAIAHVTWPLAFVVIGLALVLAGARR